MPCNCSQQSSVERIDGPNSRLYSNCKQIERREWQVLMQCPACGQLWKVDEPDKFQVQLAMKIDRPEDMDESDEPRRKSYLLESRNGLGAERCSRIGCKATQVRDSAFCLDHLYALGWRA
jgi:sarcosine oxidase delta subunit